jgi:TM2 domain-containing membrane protein YozV
VVTDLIHILLYWLIVGIVVALIWYVIGAIPIPDPLGRILKIVVMVVACIALILTLLQYVGGVHV